MKRYNQGFGKFGPMEQTDKGEWVRYEEVRDNLNKISELYNNLNKDLLYEWHEECIKNADLEADLICYRTGFWAMAASLIAIVIGIIIQFS
jgi:hypothetical protein